VSLQGLFSASTWRDGGVHSSLYSAVENVRTSPWARALLRYRVWLIALFQAALVFVSLVTAWLLRFNFLLPNTRLLLTVAPILVAIRLAFIAWSGLLHGWWRYTGISDAITIAKATVIGSILFVICVRFGMGNAAFPRTIYILEPLISFLLLAGVRVLPRVLAKSLQKQSVPSTKVILIGAGAAAHATLREIALPGSGYQAVGCVDDDLSKAGIKVDGVPVLGTADDLPALAKKYGVKDALIAVPSATPDQLQRFVEICRAAELRFKVVPSLRGILNGWIDPLPFQEACLENLLGRDPVEINLDAVGKQIEGQAVLVTGAAGTIGSELCRQVLQFNPATLICLDRNETGVFYLQMELNARKGSTSLVFCVTDFGDRERVTEVLAGHKPGVIFHAAAYKHVPMMESNVYDAVKNNVFGLLQLLEVAEANACPSFVLISSDKAVNPVNVMGATKRVGERMIACRPAGRMRCISVRFGNVLGSNGSVVRILENQLRNHQQLTITHPEVTRFFMTTREAAALVLQALAIGTHGDTLLLEMGTPVRILDLANRLIRVSGKSEREVSIQFTGLREGEKLCEELSYPHERIYPTSSPKIGRIPGTPHGSLELNRRLLELRQAMHGRSDAAIRDKVKGIVPEYSPKSGNGTGHIGTSPGPKDVAPLIVRAMAASR